MPANFAKITLAALLAAAAVSLSFATSAQAAEGRYGFRCSITDRVVTHHSPASRGVDDVDDSSSPRIRTFVVDPDKKVWRERFLGSDGPEAPFTIKTTDAGDVVDFEGHTPMSIWLSGKWSGAFDDIRTEKGEGETTISHILGGVCEEVADIPDVDLPTRSVTGKAKKYFGAAQP
jgi:hypothetical protein